MALERVIFSGSGGQGLMFIGKLVTHMMLGRFEHVTFFPSYGSEVRGGTAHCHVILSSDEIASPIVEEADALLLMNQPSVDRFLPALSGGGIVFVNSSIAVVPAGTPVQCIPAFELAERAGDARAANVVMLGAYLRQRRMVELEEVEAQIVAASSLMSKAAETANLRALRAGWELPVGAACR